VADFRRNVDDFWGHTTESPKSLAGFLFWEAEEEELLERQSGKGIRAKKTATMVLLSHMAHFVDLIKFEFSLNKCLCFRKISSLVLLEFDIVFLTYFS
jgi:hypothetical protein